MKLFSRSSKSTEGTGEEVAAKIDPLEVSPSPSPKAASLHNTSVPPSPIKLSPSDLEGKSLSEVAKLLGYPQGQLMESHGGDFIEKGADLDTLKTPAQSQRNWRPDLQGLSEEQLKEFTEQGITIIEHLGRGGMATVYLVQDETDSDPSLAESNPFNDPLVPTYALKMVPADSPEQFHERFLLEIKALSLCEHPGIVTLKHEGKLQDGTHYYTMPLMDGGTLQSIIKEIERDPSLRNRAIEGMIEVLTTLDHLHTITGYVHRDVKPSNLLLGKEYHDTAGPLEFKLADFGIVKHSDEADSTAQSSKHRKASPNDTTLTKESGRLIGTPLYASPEQLRGDDIDTKSDQYSVGIVLYQLVTGEVPQQGQNKEAIMQARLEGAIPDPQESVPDISPKLREVIMKLLAKNPGDRYPSAKDAATNLASCLKGD